MIYILIERSSSIHSICMPIGIIWQESWSAFHFLLFSLAEDKCFITILFPREKRSVRIIRAFSRTSSSPPLSFSQWIMSLHHCPCSQDEMQLLTYFQFLVRPTFMCLLISNTVEQHLCPSDNIMLEIVIANIRLLYVSFCSGSASKFFFFSLYFIVMC